MAVSYHVVLKNALGAQVALFDDWDTLLVAQVVNGIGSFDLIISGYDARAALFEVDSQIEVYRSNLAYGIAAYIEFEGLCRDFYREIDENGKRTFRVTGTGYNDLLYRRTIAYYSGTTYTDKSAPSETIMKEFVYENAGAGAASPNRLFITGPITGFTIEGGSGTGATWTGARAYRNLLDILQEISVQTLMDFDTIGIGAALYEFRTYVGQRGLDRTTTGLNSTTGLNGAGNVPQVFSLQYGNMGTPSYKVRRSDERNAALVLGAGADSSRVVVERTDAVAMAASPVNAREITRDARNESTLAGLQTKGDQLLKQFQYTEEFDFSYIETPACQYGRDFNIGDMITAQFDEIQVNKKIVGVSARVQGGIEKAEQLFIRLSDISTA